MPNIELTSEMLAEYVYNKTNVDPKHLINEETFADFIKWLELDPAVYNSLYTLEDFAEQYAEFDCAYDNWLESRGTTNKIDQHSFNEGYQRAITDLTFNLQVLREANG
jgi:hypothetical protein